MFLKTGSKSIDYKFVTVFTVLIVCFPVDDLSCMKTWKNYSFYFKDHIKFFLKKQKTSKNTKFYPQDKFCQVRGFCCIFENIFIIFGGHLGIVGKRRFRACLKIQSNHLKEL